MSHPMKYLTSSVIAALILIGLLASCGGDEKLNEENGSSGQVTSSTPVEKPFVVSLSTDNIAKGNELYQKTCSPCHGTSGKGDGPASVALNPKPRDHSNGAYMDKLTNRHIYNVIKFGGGQYGYPTMPAQPQLSDQEIAEIIAKVRSLSSTYKQ
jgi:mono/diheme cytochrome c family protein